MKRIKSLIAPTIVIFCMCLISGCHVNPPQPADLTKTELINKAKYGVVIVADTFLTGSGVVVEAGENGCIIVTNYHVVKACVAQKKRSQIRFWKGDYVDAEILGYCKDYDIAVLKTDYVPSQIYVFSLDNNGNENTNNQKEGDTALNFAKKAELGQQILSLGYTDLQLCAYDGIVSCVPKLAKVNHLGTDTHLYLTETTSIAPTGTSGGACFDLSGNLIGLNAFAYTENDVMTGLSYKIPMEIVAAVVNKILATNDYPFPLATGFSINADGEISLIYLGGLTVKIDRELIIVVDSDLPRYKAGDVVSLVNGKAVDPFTFISEVILAGSDLIITTKAA